MHMVRAFEDAGAAAVQIEDQLLPKKCGHLNDKKLARAATRWRRRSPPPPRRAGISTSSRAPMRSKAKACDGAIARARLYIEAGADAIFPEALHDADAFRTFAEAVKAPLLANMTEFGRSPAVTAR